MQVSRKQKSRFRAWRFCRHLSRFVDRHRFEYFVLTQQIVDAEWKRQTHGMKSLSPGEAALITPLRDAQRWKEVMIDGLVDEMADWWSLGWGWIYPMLDEVRRIEGDWIMKKALLEIKKRCSDDFLGFLMARGGCERHISKLLN